ncbi:DUF6773 family protein [Paenibacillus donghaensis]|uniref:Uncharacterized protein n=1 Tax=Paenibacillus donghaensis TaxID=414771 RepID=A0A2Z2K8T3_9BACL|nr:DUF6773 family protein [Paenibacillus donghaensis]ASA21727.1 hypothetical protein B9T62_13675 [Paenibacillus donghaensis]
MLKQRQGKVKDERIMAEVNRFSAHGFAIVMVGLLVSLVVKIWILELDVSAYLDTFLILMAACLYVTVRNIRAGMFLLPDKPSEVKKLKSANLMGSALSAVIYTVLMFVYDLRGSGEVELWKEVSGALIGGVIFFFGTLGLQWLMLKWSNKNAEKELE